MLYKNHSTTAQRSLTQPKTRRYRNEEQEVTLEYFIYVSDIQWFVTVQSIRIIFSSKAIYFTHLFGYIHVVVFDNRTQ